MTGADRVVAGTAQRPFLDDVHQLVDVIKAGLWAARAWQFEPVTQGLLGYFEPQQLLALAFALEPFDVAVVILVGGIQPIPLIVRVVEGDAGEP